MSHFAISCPPLPGHINPFCVLGRELVRRGHKVTLFSMLDTEQMIRDQEIGFCPIAEKQAPAGSLLPLLDAMKGQQGIRGNLFVLREAAGIFRLILDHAPSALQRAGVEFVLADQNEPAMATVAEHLQVPFASICTSLPFNREAEIPPSFTGWDYGTSMSAKIRNNLGYKVSDFLTRNLQATLNAYRSRWGLLPLRSPDDSFSPLTQIAQMPVEFDFPRRSTRNSINYTGPWIDDTFEDRVSGSEFPYDKLDGRPIVYVSLGTLQSSSSRHFETIAEASVGLPLQIVISVGAKPGTALPKLAGNHLIVPFAPQIQLLKRSVLAITHAGMNTTMHALYSGTPLIAIPLAHDQPAIAARLARTGAGILLPPSKATVTRLRSAIELILKKDSPWQAEAKRMQLAIAKAGGVSRAAEIIGQKLRSPQAATAPA